MANLFEFKLFYYETIIIKYYYYPDSDSLKWKGDRLFLEFPAGQ